MLICQFFSHLVETNLYNCYVLLPHTSWNKGPRKNHLWLHHPEQPRLFLPISSDFRWLKEILCWPFKTGQNWHRTSSHNISSRNNWLSKKLLICRVCCGIQENANFYCSDMVLKYRDLCRIKDRARAGLREALDHSGLSDEQKKAFLDGDADSACRGSNLCDVLANWVFL